MKIKGQIRELLPVENIGEHKKATVIINTGGEYANDIAIDFWNGKIDQTKRLRVGEWATIHISAESKENNGKYYTNIKGREIEF